MREAFYQPMLDLLEFQKLREDMKKKEGFFLVTGAIDSQKSHLIAALGRDCPLRVIIAPNDLRAKEIMDNFALFEDHLYYYPARDYIFFQADVQSSFLTQQRVAVMKALASGENCTIVLTMTALLSHAMPAERWASSVRELKSGSEIDRDEEVRQLVCMGYERTETVSGPGQFAVRGSILDIYPLTEENPVRIELWGDEIDSIRSFDVLSQRSIEELDSLEVYPASEFVTDPETTARGVKKIRAEEEKTEKKLRAKAQNEEAHRLRTTVDEMLSRLEDLGDTRAMEGYCDYFYPDSVSLLDYFPRSAAIFLDEPAHIQEAADAAEKEYADSMTHRLTGGYVLPGQCSLLYTQKEIQARLSKRCLVGVSTLGNGKSPFPVTESVEIAASGTSSYNNNFDLLLKDLASWKKKKYRVILLSASRTRGKRLADELTQEGVIAFYSEDEKRVLQPGEIMVTYGSVHRGYEYPMIKFAVVSETDIFGREKQKKRKKQKVYEGSRIASLSDLNPGDYVVHENHGIGIYRGVEKVTVDGVQKDYMKIEYAGGSNLYVLATQLDMIQKYADADSKAPKVNRLGGTEWTRTKSRVKTAVATIAQELVDLYAERQKENGYVFGPDTLWQKEFEELFPFEETEDQLKAIADTKKDMESPKIMDRLICGDVGYGKTEIALRAAFKAVQESKQVAFLVPTTILAQQHYNTFLQRMKDFPVKIALMCRFRTKAQQAETVKQLKSGEVDIVIGTHRLLSKDIQFRNLGLLVVDEEQRFGVTHKEKIKQMRKNVDVLTLTATPIPRTLHMSLVGIRDMSVLEEAPQDRLPIQTFVMEYSPETVREAIARELARGGQVYFVYNHISTIADITAKLQELVPEARIAFAHGKMPQQQLEDIMYDFINDDLDVLVSTTIVETGLDIPNCNTIIVYDADRMGLAQLYQLRGRVGRSNRTAYAFLMYRKDKLLKEVAEKRLSAIREFTELGSGFKIAMRDLEIRGAGNLLGEAQSGHIAEVGYDLYCKLLNESVKSLKGEATVSGDFETAIDLDVDAFIPDRYVKNENQKLDLYKRIACISTEEEYDDMLDELMDRYGEPPRSVQNLLKCALLKAQAHRVYLTDVTRKGSEICFTLYEKAKIDPAKIDGFVKRYLGKMTFAVNPKTKIAYFLYKKPQQSAAKSTELLMLVKEILEAMEELVLKEEGT